MTNWITTSPSDLFGVFISAVFTYAAILLLCRLTGLRSFSKMSAADFAMTVAVGSLFAATISSPSPALLLGIFALAMLFLGQWILAALRAKVPDAVQFLDNEPLLLMDGPKFLDENLAKSKVTRSDVVARLREANVLNLDQVKAVVFETTGDISVLHSSDRDLEVQTELMEGVRRET